MQEPLHIKNRVKDPAWFQMAGSQTAKTALDIAALIIIGPLCVVFILLPWLAYCAVLDCLGIIKDRGDPVRDEIEKWEAQRQQREELPQRERDAA